MEPRPHLLIVDDEEGWRLALRRVLRSLEARVTEVEDGIEVLETCLQDPPDLILMDMRMPRQTGPDTCRQLRSHPATRDLPIIILSSMADAEQKVEALRAGAQDYVTKPYDPEEVRARVQTHLELRRRGQEIERQRRDLAEALEESRTLNRQVLLVNERLLRSEHERHPGRRDSAEDLAAPLRHARHLLASLRSVPPGAPLPAPLIPPCLEAAEALERRLDNLLLLSQLQEGRHPSRVAPVALPQLFQDVLAAFEARFSPLGLRLVFVPGPGLQDLSFRTDGPKLARLLGNLLDHACQRAPRPGCVWMRGDGWQGGLRVQVVDEGPPPRALESLLDPLGPDGPPFHGLLVARALADVLGGSLTALLEADSRLVLQADLPSLADLEALADADEDGMAVL